MYEFLKANWTNIIGWCFAIFSIVYAFNESRKNKDLKEIIRVNNWILFQRTSNLGGIIQKSLNKARGKDMDRDLFEDIVRSDALCAELMKENVRLIYTFEPSFTEKDIDKWVSEGKISGGYDDIFKKYMISKE